MSRPPGVTTGRMHHLFSDNEDHFFLMADYAAEVLDIREQFPLFPEDATREIARSMGIQHPKYPYSTTPVVVTTDFLAYSMPNWTPIPSQTGHPFHGKLDSQSSANWTPIPLQTGQFEAV